MFALTRFAAFLGGAEGIPKQVMAIDVNNLSYDQLQPLAFLTSLTSSEVFDSLSCSYLRNVSIRKMVNNTNTHLLRTLQVCTTF
jgi:hypothetical protein